MNKNNTHRKYFQGVVVSDKMDKTIVVKVETTKMHPIYKKYIKKWKKYKVHDQTNQAKEGDVVLIGETRPLSATKYFELIKIVKKQG
ncbi:MAG: 30S ribosomal protein S17 [Spirochaetes bacterium]|nr:30S ribosomal protein S17 [Spirochaetota bacterium]NLJ04553.1 30S ribosomal protein S17 [Exilispira sp.]MBP8990831.1 30S ribosomal protein S17 [Spirochaetota bacterium]HNV44771.1 30S ribosomal protein S17 [Exilispira sp.]HOV45594.1 30S ribosomal protein S17 [Exilispira sp.]